MEKIPTAEDIKRLIPDIDESLVYDHLTRLGPRYFNSFSREEISRHIQGVSDLAGGKPVEVLCNGGEELLTITVIGWDYPAVLSLITGILASMGFEIQSGNIYTYRKIERKTTSRDMRLRGRGKQVPDNKTGRIIIDNFTGSLHGERFSTLWFDQLQARLREIFSLLKKGDESSVTRAKETVNEMASAKLAGLTETQSIFYPIRIEVDNSRDDVTVMKVYCEDTPFFLFALTTALSLQGIQIENVNISTIGNEIIDEFSIVDHRGSKITDPDRLDTIKISILLTKQFTYFLGTAPDPYAALERFEYITKELVSYKRKDWVDQLSNPHLLKDLARLLGASDFLWEDFIRLQYESVLPMLDRAPGSRSFAQPVDTISERLDRALAGAENLDDRRRILNEFKDREIYLIDLDHILNPEIDFRELSHHLTVLAESVVKKAASLSYEELAERHGEPKSVAGLEANYCILGLGKFGGAALGYASDIELLFVYSDNGYTGGSESITNSAFFDLLVKEVIRFIQAKKEGIFDLDMRLRPYGNDGPLACSLDSFVAYYGPGGEAHSYEKLALVRMRSIGGDLEFGSRRERLRNEFVYTAKSIDLAELHDLRMKQYQEKTDAGRINAKFSPGALVDLEYTVQILQVLYGRDHTRLRTPKIHKALDALTGLGILDGDERSRLIGAYDFFRMLINGLRMLRGSARDLFLPPVVSSEFGHLARRMGYRDRGEYTAVQQLHVEFETHSATVRSFIEGRFGRDFLPADTIGTVADLVISKNPSRELADVILKKYGFKETGTAYENIRRLGETPEGKMHFARIAVLAVDILARTPDPDMGLNNWERFVSGSGYPVAHYQTMLSQPKRLDILLRIFSTSQFLSETLIRNPDLLEWVISPENLYKSLQKPDIERELRELCMKKNRGEWLNRIRHVKKREILRIGTRDICLGFPLEDIVKDLSVLAEAYIEVITDNYLVNLKDEYPGLNIEDIAKRFSVMAFGKLGGSELNYSSDIDLLLVYENCKKPELDDPLVSEIYSTLLERIAVDLSDHLEEGYAYRVDLRLRPYGSAGTLASSLDSILDYFSRNASLWEVQALLKLRPVAGDTAFGERVMSSLEKIFQRDISPDAVVDSIDRLRREAVRKSARGILSKRVDVKNGIGGIRDIEFLTQGIQLIHIRNHPELVIGNTVHALRKLSELNLLDEYEAGQLVLGYNFLRRVEHYLQLYEDRQVHTIPNDPVQQTALARIMFGSSSTGEQFLDALRECMDRAREAYNRYLISPSSNR